MMLAHVHIQLINRTIDNIIDYVVYIIYDRMITHSTLNSMFITTLGVEYSTYTLGSDKSHLLVFSMKECVIIKILLDDMYEPSSAIIDVSPIDERTQCICTVNIHCRPHLH